jgi:hypothetical protein
MMQIGPCSDRLSMFDRQKQSLSALRMGFRRRDNGLNITEELVIRILI